MSRPTAFVRLLTTLAVIATAAVSQSGCADKLRDTLERLAPELHRINSHLITTAAALPAPVAADAGYVDVNDIVFEDVMTQQNNTFTVAQEFLLDRTPKPYDPDRSDVGLDVHSPFEHFYRLTAGPYGDYDGITLDNTSKWERLSAEALARSKYAIMSRLLEHKAPQIVEIGGKLSYLSGSARMAFWVIDLGKPAGAGAVVGSFTAEVATPEAISFSTFEHEQASSQRATEELAQRMSNDIRKVFEQHVKPHATTFSMIENKQSSSEYTRSTLR